MNEVQLSSSSGIEIEASEYGHVLGEPLSDLSARRRQAAAFAAALLLHLSVPLLLLLPSPERLAEPAAIPVELVLLPEPKPPPKPPLEAAREVPPQPQPYRESGGDPELAPGKPPEAKPQDKPEPAQPAEKPAPVSAPAPTAPPLAEAPAPPLPVPRPAERAKANESVAALPPARQPQAPTPSAPATLTPNDSSLIGKGGGDRYLNKVRDSILGNLIYPGSAQSQRLAGVAKYEIVIDRQGRLLGLRLLHSTGADMLDRAGRDAVELAAPFGPPPADVIGDQIGMELTLYIGPDAQKFQ